MCYQSTPIWLEIDSIRSIPISIEIHCAKSDTHAIPYDFLCKFSFRVMWLDAYVCVSDWIDHILNVFFLFSSLSSVSYLCVIFFYLLFRLSKWTVLSWCWYVGNNLWPGISVSNCLLRVRANLFELGHHICVSIPGYEVNLLTPIHQYSRWSDQISSIDIKSTKNVDLEKKQWSIQSKRK